MRVILAVLFRVLVALLPAAWLRVALTRAYPLRVINGEQGPYLYRWILRRRSDGSATYLHWFARGDADRALHDHPWDGRALILAWGYREERRFSVGRAGVTRNLVASGRVNWSFSPSVEEADACALRTGCMVLMRAHKFLAENRISAEMFHRVELIRPDKGCWSLFEVGPRRKSWSFWDPKTGETTPWRRYLAGREIPPDGGTMTPRTW